MKATSLASALLLDFILVSFANAAMIFTDRAAFETGVQDTIRDDYENPGYQIPLVNVLTNATMSAVFGETRYKSTGFPDLNMTEIGVAPGNYEYCAGCNGSYLLDFTSTSISRPSGVFGVGIDYYNAEAAFHALVTFGDDSTADYALAGGLTRYSFFGITSDLGIKTMHMGLANGGTTQQYSFTQDNLTIGNERIGSVIPEPSTLPLLAFSLAALFGAARCAKRSKT